MGRGTLVVLLVVLLFLPFISADSVDSEIQKITYYAEEYEIGNIDYVKLMLHISSSRESLNNILSAKNKDLGGIVKQDKLREVLGEPNEQTKWVWVEGEEQDVKLDYYVPIWKKIVFDGNKIQIRMEAYPSIFKKKILEEEFEEKISAEIEEGSIIYRLHFEIEFKKPEEQLDIQGKINEIQELAQSGASIETLAEKSVNAEMIFRNYFMQSSGKCEEIMKSVFGSENQRQTQQILLNEIEFCGGDNFDGIMRLEMCDECEWNWISLDFHFEGRGPGFKSPKEVEFENSKENYEGMSSEGFMTKTKELINEMQTFCQEENYEQAIASSQKLRMVTESWNQNANDVWNQIEKPNEQPENIEDPYWWIKQDQLQRQKANDLKKQNYESRKAFYLNLFSGYDKQEYYFEQTDFEKRLIEEFREKGEEICNNNQDDNENGNIDCDDNQCGGKICGKGTALTDGNNSVEVNFYCISGVCQVKEETDETERPVCGNNICEEGEANAGQNGTCHEDCIECPHHDAIECSGKVKFAGEDEKGCPLSPICIEEKKDCDNSEDCPQPTCGVAECIRENSEDEFGECKVTTLTLCEDGECEDGEKQIKECDNKEQIVSLICEEGTWIDTDAKCSEGDSEDCNEYCKDYMSTTIPACPGNLKISGTSPDCKCNWVCDEIVKAECTTKQDCGGKNDVCSNGKCETIPEKISVEPEEPKSKTEETQEEENEKEFIPESNSEPEVEEQPEEEQVSEPEPEESSQEETPATGGIIFSFFRNLVGSITGSEVEEGDNSDSEDSGESNDDSGGENNEESTDTGDNAESPIDDDGVDTEDSGDENIDSEFEYEEDYHDEEDYYDDSEEWRERDREEKERHEEEQRERCNQDCKRPCVEECIRESCGESMECDIDEESKKCEGQCDASQDCVEKCMNGEEDWWKEFEDEHQEEKGVFMVGGGCRKEQGRTDGYIWFGGWGDPFGEIEKLKNKYYEFGSEDWCKNEIDNLIKQRQELEKGFNQEFAVWFFEKYLPNSAEQWEQSVSGIFELYWNNVDNQMRLAHTMQCLEEDDINELMKINLINIEYETAYGKIEYWEELKQVNVPGLETPVTIVSPYMKIWVFPPKEFMIYEMQKAMEEHEFPGSSEEKLNRNNEEGLTEEEKQEILNNRRLMKTTKTLSEKYEGNLDLIIQFKDYETDEIVFNLYAQVNEHDIMKVEPMLPSDNPAEDVRIELDFSILYEIIQETEKGMRSERLESPPWDRRIQPIQKIKEFISGAKMYFKMNDLLNSAKYYPEDSEKDVKTILEFFFKSMFGSDEEKSNDGNEEQESKEFSAENEGISGKAIWISSF